MFPDAELPDLSESLLSEMKSTEGILDTKLSNRDHKSSPDLSDPTESPDSLNSNLSSSTTCTPEDSEDDLPEDKARKIRRWNLFKIVFTFFVDSKYFFSKCIRPDQHGTAAQHKLTVELKMTFGAIWKGVLIMGLVSFIIKCIHIPLNQFLVRPKGVGLI